MPPMILSIAAKVLYWAFVESNDMMPHRNDTAVSTPPATTNTSMWETPFIRCL